MAGERAPTAVVLASCWFPCCPAGCGVGLGDRGPPGQGAQDKVTTVTTTKAQDTVPTTTVEAMQVPLNPSGRLVGAEMAWRDRPAPFPRPCSQVVARRTVPSGQGQHLRFPLLGHLRR